MTHSQNQDLERIRALQRIDRRLDPGSDDWNQRLVADLHDYEADFNTMVDVLHELS